MISPQAEARIIAKKYDLFKEQDDTQMHIHFSQILKKLDTFNQAEEDFQKYKKYSFFGFFTLSLIMLIGFVLQFKHLHTFQNLKIQDYNTITYENSSMLNEIQTQIQNLVDRVDDLQNMNKKISQSLKNQISNLNATTYEKTFFMLDEIQSQIQGIITRFDNLQNVKVKNISQSPSNQTQTPILVIEKNGFVKMFFAYLLSFLIGAAIIITNAKFFNL